MKNIRLALLSLGVSCILTAFSITEVKRIESYDFIPSNNPHYQLLENDGKKFFCYNSIQVGKVHERRFVAGDEVYYFTREFFPMSSKLEITNQRDQLIVHGSFSSSQSNFYLNRNERYDIEEEGTDISIFKDGQLIMNTQAITDPNYGSRINLEYFVQDPNLKFLKLMALESTLTTLEKIDKIEKKSASRKSRY